MLQLPQLRMEAPPALETIRTRLESADFQRFSDIAQLVGATDIGPVIRVVLAEEGSDLARGVSPWIAGFAVSDRDLVVLFPFRSPSYPNNTLEDVLRHEVAHVLIGRAAGGRPVPRWFNEGLAMAAERDRRFKDETQLLYQLATGSRTSLEELDRLFAGGQSEQTRAYALAGALVQDLLRQHGQAVAREILMRVRNGRPFEAAFTDVAGTTPASAASDFWSRQRFWTTWLPIVSSTTTLWLAVTMVALLAIYRRWRRNLEIEKKWEDEDGEN